VAVLFLISLLPFFALRLTEKGDWFLEKSIKVTPTVVNKCPPLAVERKFFYRINFN
jgi:hypothetical protein